MENLDFDKRISEAKRQIEEDRKNPPRMQLEGTDEFRERMRLQQYADPLTLRREVSNQN